MANYNFLQNAYNPFNQSDYTTAMSGRQSTYTTPRQSYGTGISPDSSATLQGNYAAALAPYGGWSNGRPPIETSLAYLSPANVRNLGTATGPYVNTSLGYGTTIGSPEQWLQTSNQFSQGQVIASSIPGAYNYMSPERAKELGLISDGKGGYVWKPDDAELAAYKAFYNSPEGLAAIQNATTTKNVSPFSAHTAGGQAERIASGQITKDIYGNTITGIDANGQPVYGNAATTAATTGTTGTSSSGSSTFNYPMNPLTDLLSYYPVSSQLGLLGAMQSEPYLQAVLKPLVSDAFKSIAVTGLPSSTQADQAISDVISQAYLGNLNNVLSGYNNLTGQMGNLTSAYEYPYDQALQMIKDLNL